MFTRTRDTDVLTSAAPVLPPPNNSGGRRLLKARAALQSAIFNSAHFSSIATDAHGVIQIFNTGAERMFGYTAKEVVNRLGPAALSDPHELIARGSALSVELGISIAPGLDALSCKAARGIEDIYGLTYIRKNGSRFPAVVSVTSLRDGLGRLIGYLLIASDNSLRQRNSAQEAGRARLREENQAAAREHYETLLREEMKIAVAENGAKSAFLAYMSHEIRTPISAVLGLMYLLNQTRLNDEQVAIIAKIKTAGHSLLLIINDVLDLSKIEAGALVIEHAAFNLREVLEEVTDLMSVGAESKGIIFKVAAPAGLPLVLQGDANRLKQILTNLLSNAIKFTDRGWVEIAVRRLATPSGGVKLCFIVSDTGIGIAADAQARLFSPFSQADASIARRYGGTGLGLLIVKQLTTLLGGEVTLTSLPGAGSTFSVTLEFALPAQPFSSDPPTGTTTPRRERPLLGMRILVVDDSKIRRDMVKRILELRGASVLLAMNGLEAFGCLQAEPDAVDVVLMDLQMPPVDGHTATQQIREGLGLVDLPIVALTGYAMDHEPLYSSAGMKPFDSQMLVQSLMRYRKSLPASTMVPIQELAATLGKAGERSREPAEVALVTTPAAARGTAGSLQLEKQALVDHLLLFRQQSRLASEHFGSISPQLRRLLDAGTLEVLREQIDTLPFSEAKVALEL